MVNDPIPVSQRNIIKRNDHLFPIIPDTPEIAEFTLNDGFVSK